MLRAGDLIVLNGQLGAGKTTLVRGIGEGLDVRGPVTSPTFVIARVHPALGGSAARQRWMTWTWMPTWSGRSPWWNGAGA